MSRAIVKYHNDYLQLFMPDGQVIPEQTNLILENSYGDKKTATVTITLLADISQIGESVNNEFDQQKVIKDLEDKLYQSHKSAVFWETLYNTEKKRSWIDKILGI